MFDRSFQPLPLDDRVGLRLVGELDMATAADLSAALAALPQGQATLDFAELSFIDSSGLHAIAAYAGSLNGSGPVVLENVSAAIRRVFEITALDRHPGIELKTVDGDGS